MSITTYVIGIKTPDEKFESMKAIYDSCTKMKIGIPDEVRKYFNDEAPDENGVVVNIDSTKYHGNEMYSAKEVDISKLDKDIKILRFCRC